MLSVSLLSEKIYAFDEPKGKSRRFFEGSPAIE
jgi:hypothetical protein